WSVTCLFVARPFRRKGVSTQLLRAAAAHAKRQGAAMVEGYPVDPRQNTVPDAFVWTGLVSAFRKAGFREVARRCATRPIMSLARKQGRKWKAARAGSLRPKSEGGRPKEVRTRRATG